LKHGKKTKINCIQLIFIIILIASICGIVCYLCIANKEKQEYKNLQENMATENHTDEKSDRIEKVKELQKENSDIVAWIEIEGTNIEKIVPIYVGSSTEEGKLKKETIVVPIKNDSKYIINDNSNDSNQVTSEETNVNKRKDDRNKAENQVINSEHNNEQVSIETEKKLCDIQNTSIVKISRRKKSLIIYWKKAKNVSGYQIQYGLTKKCKGKRVNVKVGKKCSKKINKLRPNIRYYFRIRTYVVKNNITYYSKWSKVKKKKTK